METDLVLPIVVAEGLDVCLYRSIEAAQLDIEGPDAIAGIYRAYDASGERLLTRGTGGASDYSARVYFERAGPRPEELTALLREFLTALGHTGPLAEPDPQVWVRATLERVGYCR